MAARKSSKIKFALRTALAAFFIALFAGMECASVERAPSTVQEQYEAATRDLKKQRFGESKYNFRQIYTEYPSSDIADDALYRVGYICCVQGDYEEATGIFELLLKEYPDSRWSFDAEVWLGLLREAESAKAELQRVSARLDNVKTREPENSGEETEDLSGRVEELQAELEELREENRKLREIIESME